MIVLDASFIVKLVLEEPYSDEAESTVKELVRRGELSEKIKEVRGELGKGIDDSRDVIAARITALGKRVGLRVRLGA